MQVEVTAMPRDSKGRRQVKKLRREGKIPGILYGHEFDPIPIAIDEKRFKHLLRHEDLHGLLNLKVEGVEDGDYTVVLKEIQRHPLRDDILHVDFQRIRGDEELTAEVSLHFVGEPVGVKAGGILQHYLYEVTVQCLPKDLPESIEVDISRLNLKENLRIHDLPTLENVHYLNNPEEIVAAVTPKRVREAVAVVEEEAAEEGVEEAPEAAEEAPGEAAPTGEEEETPPEEAQ
jgi:large subunit ribosomal protein L25